MNIEKYNFPIGTKAEIKENNGELFYNLTYESPNKIVTPFGVIAEKWFSTENRSVEDAVSNFEKSLEANGFTKINNIWQ